MKAMTKKQIRAKIDELIEEYNETSNEKEKTIIKEKIENWDQVLRSKYKR